MNILSILILSVLILAIIFSLCLILIKIIKLLKVPKSKKRSRTNLYISAVILAVVSIIIQHEIVGPLIGPDNHYEFLKPIGYVSKDWTFNIFVHVIITILACAPFSAKYWEDYRAGFLIVLLPLFSAIIYALVWYLITQILLYFLIFTAACALLGGGGSRIVAIFFKDE